MDGAPETLAHWRWLAGRAMAEAAAGPGAARSSSTCRSASRCCPTGRWDAGAGRWRAQPFVAAITGRRMLDGDALDALAGAAGAGASAG